ncbi:tyrosinase [Coccidioides immitis RS]|uniref:Tyrosinase n=2 Tax=Coccidioides immitis TaxID=5501 RepID=J3K3P9_COCIM|nr:tyrosinase [Coccidioides immitis RS]EAS28837.3 tyrosinase [Coccidioides immitis RS]KMP05954.1 tyrosinase [Coccidioides immitis RMSCC 2394]TPX22990.1 hypothetical protein DIZ76_014872 [Coccidioides immitis]
MAAKGAWLWAVLQVIACITFQAHAYDIRGVRGGVQASGERPARQNLETFQESGPAFDLYILALLKFQDEDQNRMLSYYDVSSIHGYPFEAWDGVEGIGGGGYCAHASTIFPTWHRPYLALFEEMIWKHAQVIARGYRDSLRSTYVEAARTLRIPYWDWASNPELPRCVVTPQIRITTPNGEATIKNPLYSYTINPSAGKGFPPRDPLSQYPDTVRAPDDEGRSQMEEVQRRLRANGAYFRQSTYSLLSSEPNYTIFSTSAVRDRGNNYNNLETIHGQVHVAVGGPGGHMTYVPWSSFDPVFWLHHANVDRLLAMWQAIYPDSWVQPLASMSRTYVSSAGTVEDGNTPLAPFHSRGSAFWTSNSARSTRAFGYTYPEIQDWGVSAAQLRSSVRQHANRLYNRRRRRRSEHGLKLPGFGKGKLFDFSSVLEKAFKFTEVLTDLAEMSLADFDKLGINNLHKQWVANIKVDMYAISNPFRIHFFLGEPPSDPKTWDHAPNLVGTYSLFSNSMPNPTDTAHYVYGQMPLSHAIAEAHSHSLIKDIGAAGVVPLLKTHLQWRVQELSGRVIDVSKFSDSSVGGEPGLEVYIVERDVDPVGETTEFPRFSDWKVYKEVTEGKPGGVKSGGSSHGIRKHFAGGHGRHGGQKHASCKAGNKNSHSY